ncbi:MAG: ribbon-helix-helix protein, CopG family [Chloroflexi bacterium]|nr:ribbon-helix-helix protein, CopG family [Chloroflexota bacterium]
MQRTNIYLDEDQLRALKYLAAEERQSLADLVRRAVNDYLAKRLAGDTEWRQHFDRLIERIHGRTPEDVTPEEIESDITAAREEVRQAHRARRC